MLYKGIIFDDDKTYFSNLYTDIEGVFFESEESGYKFLQGLYPNSRMDYETGEEPVLVIGQNCYAYLVPCSINDFNEVIFENVFKEYKKHKIKDDLYKLGITPRFFIEAYREAMLLDVYVDPGLYMNRLQKIVDRFNKKAAEEKPVGFDEEVPF